MEWNWPNPLIRPGAGTFSPTGDGPDFAGVASILSSRDLHDTAILIVDRRAADGTVRKEIYGPFPSPKVFITETRSPPFQQLWSQFVSQRCVSSMKTNTTVRKIGGVMSHCHFSRRCLEGTYTTLFMPSYRKPSCNTCEHCSLSHFPFVHAVINFRFLSQFDTTQAVFFLAEAD